MGDSEAATTYVRDPTCVACGVRDLLIVTTVRGVVEFHGTDAVAVRALLASAWQPIVPSQHLEPGMSTGGPGREIVAKLVQAGALIKKAVAEAITEGEPESRHKPCRRLVVAITGAIQTTDILVYIDELLARFTDDLEIVLTEPARNFVQLRSFDYLYGHRPWLDESESREGVRVPHIHLAQWAELVIVLPATAHTIQKLATAACSDLVSLVVAATRAPVVLVPAMNPEMWANAAVRRNLDRVRDDGMFVIEPGYGFEAADPMHGKMIGGPGVSPRVLPTILAGVLGRARQDDPR